MAPVSVVILWESIFGDVEPIDVDDEELEISKFVFRIKVEEGKSSDLYLIVTNNTVEDALIQGAMGI